MIDLYAIVLSYGLPGLLLASLIGSTIFVPFTTEILFPVLIKASISPVEIVLYAAFGSLLGTIVNYALGFYGTKLVQKHIQGANADKAQSIMDKYGWLGLFVIMVVPLPLPVDPATILCGITKMNFLEFCATVLLAKIVKYSLEVGLIAVIL